MGRPLKKPVVSAFMSLLWTGLGQAFNQQPRKAVLFAILPDAAPLLLSWVGGWQTFSRLATILAAVLAFKVFVIVDAWRVARREVQPVASRASLGIAYGFLTVLLVAHLAALENATYLSRLVRVPAFRVASSSMIPTILNGERITVDILGFREQAPQRGGLVVVDLQGRGLFVRRVVALPGDVVLGNGKEILVNGQTLPAPHWREEVPGLSSSALAYWVSFEPITIGPDELYVLGDSYLRSLDGEPRSNLVRREQVWGKPLYIYWSDDFRRIGRTLK